MDVDARKQEMLALTHAIAWIEQVKKSDVHEGYEQPRRVLQRMRLWQAISILQRIYDTYEGH